MLGHLVSTSRQSPPDFGVASWLRKTIGGLQSLLQHSLAPRHPRKQLHPQ